MAKIKINYFQRQIQLQFQFKSEDPPQGCFSFVEALILV